MTKEEAIKELSYIADEMPSMECADWKEAISMAIKALEQEPCENAIKYFKIINELSETLGVSYDFVDEKVREAIIALKVLPQKPCTDAISREAVIDIIEDVCPIYGNDYRYILRERVNDLPPVTPAEKVGHWIIYDVHGHKACKCSECNNDVGYPCTDKYCKYCGAKMQEMEE